MAASLECARYDDDRRATGRAAAPEPRPAGPAESWFTTADHKRLGLHVPLLRPGCFLVAGGVLAMLLRAHWPSPSSDILGDHYGRVLDAHAAVMTMLFLAPAWIGLATYLAAAADRLRPPGLPPPARRRPCGSTWWAAGILVASYIVRHAWPAWDHLSHAAAHDRPGQRRHQPLGAGLLVLTVATLLASANLLATALALRTDGLTLPAHARLQLVDDAHLRPVALLSTPVFAAGLVLLYIDQHFGGTVLPARWAAQVVWQHTVWLFGRPEIYLLDATRLSAPPARSSPPTTAASLEQATRSPSAPSAVFAVLSLHGAGWPAPTCPAPSCCRPTRSPPRLIALPVGVLVLVWPDTLRLGQAPART